MKTITLVMMLGVMKLMAGDKWSPEQAIVICQDSIDNDNVKAKEACTIALKHPDSRAVEKAGRLLRRIERQKGNAPSSVQKPAVPVPSKRATTKVQDHRKESPYGCMMKLRVPSDTSFRIKKQKKEVQDLVNKVFVDKAFVRWVVAFNGRANEGCLEEDEKDACIQKVKITNQKPAHFCGCREIGGLAYTNEKGVLMLREYESTVLTYDNLSYASD